MCQNNLEIWKVLYENIYMITLQSTSALMFPWNLLTVCQQLILQSNSRKIPSKYFSQWKKDDGDNEQQEEEKILDDFIFNAEGGLMDSRLLFFAQQV